MNTDGKTAVSMLLYPREEAALLVKADELSRSEEEREGCLVLVLVLISFLRVFYFTKCGQISDK